jgi:signal transduction histidine kinase/ActR/RegA family two-component response regulator
VPWGVQPLNPIPPDPRSTADRTLRDVVALSTLPAIWLGAEPARIVESLAAALWTVLEADFIYLALHGDEDHGPIAVAQTGRDQTKPDLEASLGPPLLEWALQHDPEDILLLSNPLGPGQLHITVRSLAINAEYGLLAAGFLDGGAPDARHQLLMHVAATQVTIAIENVRLLRSVRRYAAQQREAVRDAEEARAEAERASRTKDEFLAMLGHELRNPLAPIQTALQLMRLRDDGSGTRERTVIERQVTHLTRLVDDLLDVARIARGKVQLRMERLNVRDVIAKAVEIASPLIEQRRHTLDVQVPRRDLTVDGDPTRLAQAVANLLTNAAKYTEPGGHVSIRVEQAGTEIAIRVRDSGIGISAEMLPRVFDRFIQERQSIDRAQGGLGLGLSIVRSLVAMHGGTVSAHSAGVNRGSEFVIRMAAASGAAVQTPELLPGVGHTATHRDGRIRVLVVDDNEDAAAMLVEALRFMGYDVRSAHDGPAAIAVCETFKPDVALLDIGLPVMDGYEVGARLRTIPGTNAVRLYALTGYGQDADRERSRAAGFDRHFVKPLDFDLLQDAIQDVANPLDGQRA